MTRETNHPLPVDRALEGAYWTRLRERCERWAEKHPAHAAELRQAVRENMHLGSGVLTASQERAVTELWCDAVRGLNPTWPTLSMWVAAQRLAEKADG
jgi:ferric-dicitrate binding protein FerR (iron transport regulator)